ncbi:hypothetical protein [Candidatus Albibeggiatoa sp. nov. BB20]|uniref:hypothetical protein n=1 Tax=Candidatus Albibeggiatoa sp. nov. BB20 TaxID=3162723 RepID=UPI003365675C
MKYLVHYKTLITELENRFPSSTKPNHICTLPADDYRKQLQQEFGNKPRECMTYNDCTRLIFEGSLLSDNAYLYLSPRLAQATLIEDGNEFLMYCRLERINQNILAQCQQKILNQLINALKQKEAELEEEIQREAEESWKIWGQERLSRNMLADKFLYLVAKNQVEEVKKLLQQSVTLLNVKDSNGNTGFDIAKMLNHENMLQFLVSFQRASLECSPDAPRHEGIPTCHAGTR